MKEEKKYLTQITQDFVSPQIAENTSHAQVQDSSRC